MDSFTGADTVQRRLRRLTTGERREEALYFIRQFGRESGKGRDERRQRWHDVDRALGRTGSYAHTAEELAFGARLAWRNHARCIGRLIWKSLEVFDCRALQTPAEVAAQLFHHLGLALASGNTQPMISIFAPAQHDRMPVTIESAQIIQYAGHVLPDGSILGDSRAIEITRIAIALGWQPPQPPSAFDILPLIIRDAQGHRHLFAIPAELQRQVPIHHPSQPGIADLGLNWYPVPCVANMVLTIGGVDYPCAPFSGYYVATEIASRDLADVRRYNRLEAVADALGLDRAADPLWQDCALTELNRAVLHSFHDAGIRIIDHHEASAQFMEFVKLEQREGRTPNAEWSWLVPPQAAAACPVFHLPMIDRGAVPNFYLSRQSDGQALRLYRGDERHGRMRRRYYWWLDHWRDWRRKRDSIWQRH